MPESERVQQIIDTLRSVFAHQLHDIALEKNVAPARKARVRAILRKSSELSVEEVDWLTFTSMSTVGGVDTFKFALARFLEVAVLDGDYAAWAATDSYVILPKLEEAEFDNWPLAQRAAVIDALDLWSAERLQASRDDGVPDHEAAELREWVKRRRQID